MVGRLPGSPRPAGSGRKRGSLDKAQRALITEQVAKDLLTVYRKLGGVRWLLEWARENQTEFIRQGLARLMPAFPKEAGDDAPLVSLTFNGDPTEAAKRVAFLLAKGNAELDNAHEALLADRVPYVRIADEPTPQDACRSPAPDPARDQWAREVSMSQEERLNSETLDERCSRVASAPTRPEWMTAPKVGRPYVGRPRQKGDLL